MDLYIVRHAIAEERDATNWPDDSRRPLSRQGREKFQRVARGLARLAPDVDALLSSGWARAWATAEILQADADWPAPKRCEALELESCPTVLEAVAEHRDAAAVALVGHEPQLSELLSYLFTGQEETGQFELKKGGVALVRMPASLTPGGGTLAWLAPPKLLRAFA